MRPCSQHLSCFVAANLVTCQLCRCSEAHLPGALQVLFPEWLGCSAHPGCSFWRCRGAEWHVAISCLCLCPYHLLRLEDLSQRAQLSKASRCLRISQELRVGKQCQALEAAGGPTTSRYTASVLRALSRQGHVRAQALPLGRSTSFWRVQACGPSCGKRTSGEVDLE